MQIHNPVAGAGRPLTATGDRRVTPADQTVARVLIGACKADGALDLGPACTRLARIEELIKTRGGCRTYGFVQHVANRLVTYDRRHAPTGPWRLIDADPAAGLLCWSLPGNPLMPLVVDALTSTRSELPRLDPTSGVVTRVCDLSDHRNSYIHFPGENRTWPLCTADDPVRVGLSALYPNQEIPA